jgi:AraC-like DNA-binding protein
MDRSGIRMDKIGRSALRGTGVPPVSGNAKRTGALPDPSSVEAAPLLSQQVTEARYFFLNLAPSPREAFTLVMGGREQCNPDYAVSRSSFPFYCVEYVVSGHGTLELDGRRHELRAGTVFAYAPDTHCEIRADPLDPMLKFFVSFAGRGVQPRLRRAGVTPGTARALAAHAEIVSVGEDLVREGQRSGALAGRICAALGELLLLKIEDAATLSPQASEPAREAFLRCKALIDAETPRLATLAEIARLTGVEASSVCRWFRRYQGTSPYRYLLRRKMNLAAEHLVENGGLVKEAAQRVGFTDPYHFSRMFKSVHGVAPRALLAYRHAR